MSDGPLLVLGASLHQLDVIATAQRRGVRVAVADNVPSNPGHALADVSHVVDTTDVEGIAAVARAEAVRGIVAPCTEVAVSTAAAVAAMLGLPGVAPDVAALMTSKLAFRRWQRDAGLPSPAALEADGSGRQPGRGRWIVKPDRSSGSKGIRIVEGGDELPAAVAAARALGGQVIAERVVEGHHVTVEGVLRSGRLAWSIVLDRQTASPPWVVTTGHRLPTALAPAQAALAIDAVATTLGALGVADGPFDADVVVGEQAVVLEISPRLGGNSITALVKLATGLDLAGVAIDVALGRPADTTAAHDPRPAAVVLLGADEAGVLAYDAAALAALRAEPWVAAAELAAEGTPVRPFVDGRAVVGRAFVTGARRGEVDAHADAVRARLAVTAR